jgi:glycosyltransferase involved in cell wall biosynthesis
MKLSIIIPVRNEVQTIGTLVDRVRAVDYGMSREIIVVDGASTDGTREALQSLPTSDEVVLVLEDQARGKGRAVRTGFERATGDILVVQDADLELDPAQIPTLLDRLNSEGRPAVFGSRFKGHGRGDTPLLSYAGNKLLTWSANILFFTHMTDILTCYKVLRSDVVKALHLQCDGFDFDAEVPCRLLRNGYQILEIPVDYSPRSIDEGKKLTPRVGWSVLRVILQIRFSRSSAHFDLAAPAEHRS